MKSWSVASQRVPRSEKTLFVRSAEMHCVRVPGPEKLSFDDENGEGFNWSFDTLFYAMQCNVQSSYRQSDYLCDL